MEAKKLNLNQPFLSVRRPSSLIPYYKSELKSGPVGKTGSVPFHWEQTPGKPRQETTATTMMENKEERGNNNNGNEEDDDEDYYVDALSTLSRTNSTFLNCSTSGVSGLGNSDLKPSRDFTRDPNALDLVMDRFLPAAKAMVTDKPRYAPKKPTVIRGEESKDLVAKKMVAKKEDIISKPSLRYSPSYGDQYSYGKYEDCDFDDDDDDYGRGSSIPSVCGLLPRFCLTGSSGILSPVPGMSVRARIAKSRGNEVRNGSPFYCPNPEVGYGYQPEDCDVKQADVTRTVAIEESEAITGFKPPKKVSKTFAQLLKDEDGPEEKVTTEKEDRDEEVVDSHPKDLRNLQLVDISNNNSTAAEKTEFLEKKYSELIISPPLPKSPSDSWLWRTLPSVPAKNIHRHSNLGPNRNTQKVPAVGGSMWEAIVKSSKQQHDNSHYTEESLTPLQKT